MPSWVLRELNRSVFQLFYNGRSDRILLPVKSLPSHRVVAFVPLMCNGWGVSHYLHLRGFPFSLSGTIKVFGTSPVQILSNPLRFPGAGGLHGFYSALLTPWSSAGGAFLSNCGSLCMGSGLTVMSVASLYTKFAYLILLSDRLATRPCVVEFLNSFGSL